MNQTVLKPMCYQWSPNQAWDRIIETDRLNRLEFYAKQDMVHLSQLEPHNLKCAIVGGAPSVHKYIHEIDAIRRKPGLVMSINGAHKWLIDQGCPPTIHVLFEIDMDKFEDATGSPPHRSVYYYVCSHYDPKVYEALNGFKRVLWHHYDDDPEYQGHIHRLFPGEFMVSGGYVTFFRCMNIALILGFRHFEIFGCDCSFETNSHIDGYPTVAKEPEMKVAAGTKNDYRMFKTNPSLSFLAKEFMEFCKVHQAGLRIKVHGDGMLRHLHQTEYPEQYEG